MEPRQIIETLGLEPLPDEGGMFRNTIDDGDSTAIYFLLQAGQPSMLHRLPGKEVFHFYGGAPARIHIFGPGREYGDSVLGIDLKDDQRPQIVIPGGAWQAAETLGEWTLMGSTMSPGFKFEDFELADRAELAGHWPEAAELITRHTPG